MSTVLAGVNVFLGVFVAYTQFAFCRTNDCHEYKWLKMLIGIMGVYWAIIYSYVVLGNIGIIPVLDPVYFGQIFIRPVITVWLAITAGAGWLRLLTKRRNKAIIQKQFDDMEG